ncbi:hypothetical protein RJT34_13769 [Clitoria ternatea]|uniref:FRIGIDA-like protein n=1 Tax=Clitoria ternatea TaxID=43366 RepID=A0AAN9JS54_CLITE
MKDFDSKKKQVEGQIKELESKEKHLEGRVKELTSKVEEFEGQVKEVESQKYIDLHNQLEMEDLLHHPQFLPSERADELELIHYDILVNLQGSSDPPSVVLDIIKNPIDPESREGDNAIIIDGTHIFLLEQLMRISPHIKPHVREEAMKLALDLKAKMRASAENSLMVLGFLLLLSNYGLVSSFDEDEVLKLIEIVAQHKQVVEMFRNLGFADKIPAFVQNLIKKKQHIEAVRFICAYELADKENQPIDLLREYVQNAKLISESSANYEVKDKAIDQEIANLRAVLECISDNKLESEDLCNEIQGRIFELNMHKASSIYTASRPSCNNLK